jgi:uroporphyrinogen decarboxylase
MQPLAINAGRGVKWRGYGGHTLQRGPMCTAGFVRGTTDFMIDLVEKAEWAHKLLDLCTRLIIDWLKAQQKAMGGTVEGIFILDDIVGFVSEEHYQEFAHPYLKRICDAFPKDWVKIYHCRTAASTS